jgi:glycosyltransferase 2 family protein
MSDNPSPVLTPSIKEQEVRSKLRLSRMIWPFIFGLGATYYLFKTQFDLSQFFKIHWDARAFGWLTLALILLIVRHLAYMLRLRTLTGNIFSWKKTAAFITIWEFSAALAPTSKGGPFVMFFVLLRERVTAAKASTALLYTMFLDSSFFVLSFPIWYVFFGKDILMPSSAPGALQGIASGAFLATFGLMTILVTSLGTFLFLKPEVGRSFMYGFARLPFFKRFASSIQKTGDDFILASAQMRSETASYHFKAIIGTLGAWTSKFIMINCLVLAVAPEITLDGSTQIFIYARLICMFIIMTFSPSPGGAGFAEIALAGFLSDIIPQTMGMIVALIWRLMAFYAYLIAGAIVSTWYFSTPKK